MCNTETASRTLVLVTRLLLSLFQSGYNCTINTWSGKKNYSLHSKIVATMVIVLVNVFEVLLDFYKILSTFVYTNPYYSIRSE
jgi:hypothetical protein